MGVNGGGRGGSRGFFFGTVNKFTDTDDSFFSGSINTFAMRGIDHSARSITNGDSDSGNGRGGKSRGIISNNNSGNNSGDSSGSSSGNSSDMSTIGSRGDAKSVVSFLDTGIDTWNGGS